MGKAPAVPSKKKSRAPTRRRLAKQIGIVLGGGTLLAAAVGTYIVLTSADATPSASVQASTQANATPPAPVDRSGSIVIRTAAGCRRMKFDNATGAITDDGAMPCPEGGLSAGGSSSDSKAQAERFGQIANGFKR